MTIEKRITRSVDLKQFSTFGIGGVARFFFEMTSFQDALDIMSYVAKSHIPFIVIGKGSNILFDDRGYCGLVILNKILNFSFQDERVEVGSGVSFSLLGIKSALKNLSGLEFASGIPGTVGGAVYMNAGANNTETSKVILSADFIDKNGILHRLNKEDMNFSYRKSIFHDLKGVIVGAVFQLKHSCEARKKQLEIIQYRMSTQPYKNKSIGCIFRNPQKNSAGALIEQCGLKGYKLGGAKVSDLHANFIVNDRQASSKDVLCLIKIIKEKVQEKKGIELLEEIRYIPYESFGE